MKIFKINDTSEMRCEWVKTRYGFRHDARLFVNGRFHTKSKVCYQNRTWESFEYQTVIDSLLRKSKLFTTAEINTLVSQWQHKNYEAVNAQFGMLSAIMRMGEILTDGQKAQNDWKARMLRAGLGDAVDMPEDWDKLPEDEKEKRLNNVIKSFSNPIL